MRPAAQSAPLAPTGISATCVASNQKSVKVTWGAVTHATTYTVYQSTSASHRSLQLGGHRIDHHELDQRDTGQRGLLVRGGSLRGDQLGEPQLDGERQADHQLHGAQLRLNGVGSDPVPAWRSRDGRETQRCYRSPGSGAALLPPLERLCCLTTEILDSRPATEVVPPESGCLPG